MVFKTDHRKEGKENKVVPGSNEYREKIKKLIGDATRKTADEEIQKATPEKLKQVFVGIQFKDGVEVKLYGDTNPTKEKPLTEGVLAIA